jgi:hypothetical protein
MLVPLSLIAESLYSGDMRPEARHLPVLYYNTSRPWTTHQLRYDDLLVITVYFSTNERANTANGSVISRVNEVSRIFEEQQGKQASQDLWLITQMARFHSTLTLSHCIDQSLSHKLLSDS